MSFANSRLLLCSSCYRAFRCRQINAQNTLQAAVKRKEKTSTNEKRWEAVIGLEIHAQIWSSSKLFSGAATQFAARTNSQVSDFDAAMPGTLPVLNRHCVEAGVLTALALKSHINLKSSFDRKHYFYADLPAGYQITQQRQPLAVGGQLLFPYREGKHVMMKRAKLTQIQLEQDSGKSLHDPEAGYSLIDLNRAGVGLMEIVTEPDFCSADEAACFVKELHSLMLSIGTCDGRMAEGSFRVDASVSLRRPGDELGTRAEVKNLNSIRFVRRAIEYEIERQRVILERGEDVSNETRQFNSVTGETFALRDKEKVHDYRFMPEPNLPLLTLYTDNTVPAHLPADQVVNVDELRRRLPRLPDEERQRLIDTHKMSLEQVVLLMNEPGMVEAFEDIMSDTKRDLKTVLNILLIELLGVLNKWDITLRECVLPHDKLGEVIDMYADKTLSLEGVRKVFGTLVDGFSGSPRQLVLDKNWSQITDDLFLTQLCQKVIHDNPKSVASYKKGKKRVFNFFMGEVQRVTDRRAEPAACARIIRQLLQQ